MELEHLVDNLGLPLSSHRCLGVESLKCDSSDDKSFWSCQLASCSSCVDLNWNFYYGRKMANGLPFPYRRLKTTLRNIKRAAEIGCKTCSIICEGIFIVSKSLIDREPLYANWLSMSHLNIELRNRGPVVIEVCPWDDEDTTYLLVEFYTLPGCRNPYPALGIGEALPIQVSVGDCAAFVSRHMNECKQFHPICSAVVPRVLPSRVIDVLAAGSLDVRLTTLDSTSALSLPYVALSHCWGDTKTILTTTTNTIAERHGNISYSDLSKTFQEAVGITRAIGIRYLWIDSLCIIQDDEKDWLHESAKMADIYLGSTLTIAATGSTDSSGGCFFNRWTCQSGGLKTDIETFDILREFEGSYFTVCVRQAVDNGHRRMYGHASRETVTAPLLHRAWAFQERMLAPRVLHFHMEEMFWECKTCTLCECGYLGWDRDHNQSGRWYSVELNLQLKSRIAQAVDDPTSIDDVYQLWLDIVEEYSMLAITKESDRLPALSGLASFLSPKLRSPYLAGLWRDHLTVGLLWHRCSVAYSSCSRADLSQIPSWSWASLIRNQTQIEELNQLNHITYDEVRDGIIRDSRFEVVNAECHVIAGSNAFGRVSSGVISLRGALILAKYNSPRRQVRPQLQFGEEMNDTHMDLWGTKDIPEVQDEEMVFCLLFGMSKFDLASHALVLKAASAATYRRVGYLNLDAKRRWFDNVIPFVVDIV